MAYDKTKTNPKSKKSPEGTPMDSEWGFNNDGESKNTFGPAVKSTPNKVGADESISRKTGKGKITSDGSDGNEDESIFGDIDYTGNTADAGKKDYKSVDKSVFDGLNYSFTPEGQPGGEANEGIFGSANFAAGAKDKKVNGTIEKDEADKEANEGENYQGKRKLAIRGKGNNPTSQNVTISTNIFTNKRK